MLMVLAPSLITASSTRHRKSRSEREPSSGEDCTSGQALFASRTESFACSSTCSGLMRSFFSMCSALVAMNVCTRQDLAPFSASMPRWMSRSLARHRPHTVESLTTLAMARTASKSPLDEAGKPASITSTFMRSSARAMRSFSSRVIDAPGLCSPSRMVVSKMIKLSLRMEWSLGLFRPGHSTDCRQECLARGAQQQAQREERRGGKHKHGPMHDGTIARRMDSKQMTAGRLLAICAARVFLFATFMTVAAVIPLITVEWRLSATAAGAIVSSFTMCYAASVFGFAWAADHFGAKRMVVVSALAAAAASATFGFFTHDWWSAVILYGLVGLAQGGVYTPLIMLISDEVEPARRGRAMGWLIASTSAGYCVSLGAAALGIALGGLHAAFVLSGLLPAVGAVMITAAVLPFANRIHPRQAQLRVRDELVHNRESRILTAGYVAHSWELLGMWAWIPAFLAAGFALKGAEASGAAVSGAWLS